MTRPESDVIKAPAILSQRNLSVGAAVEVIEDRFRQPAASQGSQVCDTDDARRCDGAQARAIDRQARHPPCNFGWNLITAACAICEVGRGTLAPVRRGNFRMSFLHNCANNCGAAMATFES